MLLMILIATSSPPNAVSVSGSGGFVLSIEEDHEGNSLSGAYLGGARVQYDRALTRGWFVGAVGGHEHLWQPQERNDDPPNADVLQAGVTAGGRWGRTIRGGLRFAGGFAYGMTRVHSWRPLPLPGPGGQFYERRVDTPGWYLDVEGELSARVSSDWEVFLDIPIVLWRTFYYQGADARRGKWWYAVPLIPFTGTIGVRRFF